MEAGLRGQKEAWLKHWYAKSEGASPLRALVQTARDNVEADEINNDTVNNFHVRRRMNKTLPGYVKTMVQ